MTGRLSARQILTPSGWVADGVVSWDDAGRITGVSQEGFDALTHRVWKGDDLVLPFNVDWRAGIIGNSNLLYGPNPEAFGHSGNGGSMGMGDPAAGVSAGYVMNAQSHHIMGDPRSLKLIDALYACL